MKITGNSIFNVLSTVPGRYSVFRAGAIVFLLIIVITINIWGRYISQHLVHLRMIENTK